MDHSADDADPTGKSDRRWRDFQKELESLVNMNGIDSELERPDYQIAAGVVQFMRYGPSGHTPSSVSSGDSESNEHSEANVSNSHNTTESTITVEGDQITTQNNYTTNVSNPRAGVKVFTVITLLMLVGFGSFVGGAIYADAVRKPPTTQQ